MRVALGGFGSVGQKLAGLLASGAIPEARLTAISARDLEKARRNLSGIDPLPLVLPVAELPAHADVIVECATGEAFPEIARAALEAGRILVPVSVGALATHPEILDLAAAGSGTIRVVTGGLPGLDGVRSAREAGIESVRMISQIRPESLAHEEYVIGKGFDFSTPPASPVQVFAGTAREAARAFPRHFNVAAALSLAGIGFDRTMVEVWANADAPGAVHEIEVVSVAITLNLKAENRPSAENRRTSQIVAPSVIATLRSLVSPVQIGS